MENENINEKLDLIMLQNKMIQGYLQCVLIAQGLEEKQVKELREKLIKDFCDEK